ncbi:hypothetical protein H9L12_10915 [Sphingomonas rhizophila]|jgi:hypothetical protein|uniref:Lipoprotein n=1 Tax=Sphingomonas rhizophila TaxID=2071607 RepID=A0A7G9SA81_9SPHN|nr:hypothetical protein [Sphingomonas rhizophila]QNN64756.1 hypothetical protein H9L12_10915 [Sphingomonas rhizophila]
MRKFVLIAALALGVAACGGEKYPLPAAEAYASLTSVGVPHGARPLSPLHNVSINVEQIPADSSVRWSFSKDGADLGAIIAKVDPDGESASVISTDYVDGTASGDDQNRMEVGLIKGSQRQLIEEGIRAYFEKREFNSDLRKSLEMAAVHANIGGMMQEASASMDRAAKESNERRREAESEVARNPYTASAPTTDLSRFDETSR